jgi:integrase/recombinase XerD
MSMELLLQTANIEKKIETECELRGLSKKKAEDYTYHTRNFLDFSGKDPRAITLTDARRYVLHLKAKKCSATTINNKIAAIRFLYADLWKRRSFSELRSLKGHYDPHTISKADVERMIKAMPYTKHKLLIEFFFSAGCTLGEVIGLKTSDLRIDDRIAIIKGRYVVLSDRFVERYIHYLTERYYNHVNSEYVFDHKDGYMTEQAVSSVIKKACAKAGIDLSFFALRSSFATRLYETETPEYVIQQLMGYSDRKTTYGHFDTSAARMEVKSPMDAKPLYTS